MRVSVVIPVYNAAPYINQAVESALAQPETSEIILIEDGSTDNSLTLCEALSATSSKVHLLRHLNGENRGAGASRNIGILKSACEYIAFLDADDYFLPGRFDVAKVIFASNPTVDGVYEATGTHVEDQSSLERWKAVRQSPDDLTTVRRIVAAENLFAELVCGRLGYFSIDGLVVKRSLFKKCGLFDEHLLLHQDTALIDKMAAVGRLVPGRLDQPVAIRRIHRGNRILAERSNSEIYRAKMMRWAVLWEWGKTKLDRQQQNALLTGWLRTALYQPRFKTAYNSPLFRLINRTQLVLLAVEHPWLLLKPLYWYRFFPARVSGRGI